MLIKIIIIIVIVDCLTDEWSTWTMCPVTCGGATKTRSKKVLQEAMNGGAACPPLQESMRCNIEMCPSNPCPLWDIVDRRLAAAPCALWLVSLCFFVVQLTAKLRNGRTGAAAVWLVDADKEGDKRKSFETPSMEALPVETLGRRKLVALTHVKVIFSK